MNYDIVFQEIPGEVTLAINISNCPNRCKECHSPHLWKDTGTELNEEALNTLLGRYNNAITCICFMGGDSNPFEVEKLSAFIHTKTKGNIKTGWYSGKNKLPSGFDFNHFNYIKLGPYIPGLEGLKSAKTNQKFYCIEEKKMIDKTFLFWSRHI